jgi:cytoskeletal protein RodZ
MKNFEDCQPGGKSATQKGMSTVAEQLCAAREAKQLTIEQIADLTKIRTDHVRALEEGNFAAFSAPIYIRGSVKNYAATLKLDVPQILATLDAELRGTKNFSEPPPLMDQQKTFVDQLAFWVAKVNWKVGFALVVLAVFVLAAALIILATRKHHKASPDVNLPPAVYQPANNGDTLPLPKH